MATNYISTQLALQDQPKQQMSGALFTAAFDVSIPNLTGVANGDVLRLINIPVNARILDWAIFANPFDGGTFTLRSSLAVAGTTPVVLGTALQIGAQSGKVGSVGMGNATYGTFAAANIMPVVPSEAPATVGPSWSLYREAQLTFTAAPNAAVTAGVKTASGWFLLAMP